MSNARGSPSPAAVVPGGGGVSSASPSPSPAPAAGGSISISNNNNNSNNSAGGGYSRDGGGRLADVSEELIIPSPSPVHAGGSVGNNNNSNINSNNNSRLSSADTTTSGSSGGGGGGNPLRSLNPAFSLSPRADSDSEMMEAATPSQCVSRVVFDLEPDADADAEAEGGGGGGREGSPSVWTCDLASIEERRLFVSERCVQLARRMTPERIVSQLLPALLTAFECDDYSESFDDCSPRIARALPDIIAAMGRPLSPKHVVCFLGLIMELCCSAESTVTVSVTAALQRLLRMVDNAIVCELFLPLVLSMRVSFWSAPRAVAAGLLGVLAANPAVIEVTNNSNSNSGGTSAGGIAQWFAYYVESSRDAAVAVRVAAVAALPQWAAIAAQSSSGSGGSSGGSGGQLDLAHPLSLASEFIADDLSDTVRYTLAETLLPLATVIGPAAAERYLLSTYVAACTDPSWRVRYVAASHLGSFARRLPQPPDALLGPLVQLAEDEEPEVRAAVARQLALVAARLSHALTEHQCVRVAMHLTKDPVPAVRSSAVRHLYPFLLLDSDETAAAVCAGIVQLMDDPNFGVQLSAIRSLQTLVAALYGTDAAASTSTSRRQQQQQQQRSQDGGGPDGGDDDTAEDAVDSFLSGPLVSPALVADRAASAPRAASASASPGRDGSAGSRTPNTWSSAYTAHSAETPVRLSGRLDPAVRRRRVEAMVAALAEHLRLMSEAGNWRLRDAVVRAVSHFCAALPPERFAPLTATVRTLLRDPVSEVRGGAVAALGAVAECYGGEWAAATAADLLATEFAPTGQGSNYVWRVVAVECLAALLPRVCDLPHDDVRRERLTARTTELLQEFQRDAVPNVRIALARALPRLRRWFAVSPREQAAYNDAVAALRQDRDRDVVAAAAAAAPIAASELCDSGRRRPHHHNRNHHSSSRSSRRAEGAAAGDHHHSSHRRDNNEDEGDLEEDEEEDDEDDRSNGSDADDGSGTYGERYSSLPF